MMVDVTTSMFGRLGCIVATAVVLVVMSCGHGPLRNQRIDPALQKLIPPDTTMLFDAHVDRLRNSAVYQRYLSQLVREQSDEFARKTGIDPARDIDEVLSCSDGRNAVVITRFNRSDAASRLKSSGVRPTPYNGVDVYGDGKNAMAFVDSNIGVAGPMPSVKSIVDRAKQGGGEIPAALAPVVDQIPAQDQILAAMVGGVPGIAGSVGENPNLANLVRLARSIESASLGMQADNEVHLHARADCRSEEDARQVHDALHGFIALGRLAAPANRPELLKIYDAINVTREKTIVRVAAIFGQQDLETFLSLWLRNNRTAR